MEHCARTCTILANTCIPTRLYWPRWDAIPSAKCYCKDPDAHILQNGGIASFRIDVLHQTLIHKSTSVIDEKEIMVIIHCKDGPDPYKAGKIISHC